MTVAPRGPRLPVADLAGAAAALRGRGGRLSRPRREVLEALFRAEGPVSAEYLARGLDGRGTRLELTTVYRALEHLEELGVVRHVHLGHGPGLYALAQESEREYLVCEHCDRVTAVEAERLDAVRATIRAAFGYEPRFSHFPIVGLCATCLEREERREPPARGGTMDHHDEHPHTHEHTHDGETHTHPHTEHDHDHTEHEHQHSHGDHVHAHPHVHEAGLESEHEHEH